MLNLAAWSGGYTVTSYATGYSASQTQKGSIPLLTPRTATTCSTRMLVSLIQRDLDDAQKRMKRRDERKDKQIKMTQTSYV